MKILAIDQGTTSTRALELTEKGGRIIASREHRQIYPGPGWVEQDPMELLENIRFCLGACKDMDVLGMDNQGESCLAWDAKTREPVSQVLVWQDNRTADDVAALKAQGLEPVVMARAGLPLDPYFSATKLAWILEHIPRARDLHRRGRLRLGTTDAFFLDRLTGRFATDITTASRTSLMNLATGQWDPELCRLFKVPMDCLPEILPTQGDFGFVSIGDRRVAVRASVVDQQAALYGHGCRKSGDAKITFGTGAFALALVDGIPSDVKGPLPTVAWKLGEGGVQYALDGGVQCAASALNWARDLGLFSSFDQINAFEGPSAVERGLVFVPALVGLGCPHWDRKAAGTWLGLGLSTGPLDMVQAVLEGIAFRTAEVISSMEAIQPLGSRISIDGGLSKNPYFCQFLARVLGREVRVTGEVELTALGTAALAGESPYVGEGGILYAPDGGDPGRYRDLFSRGIERCRGWHGKPFD